MKKWVLIIIVVFLGVLGCFAVYVKGNHPLVSGAIMSNTDRTVVAIEVGNENRFGEIQVVDVFVNNHEEPKHLYMQVSNPLEGFMIAQEYGEEEAKAYRIQEVQNVAIKTETAPSTQLEKFNNNTATESEPSYAITVQHHEKIHQVTIHYYSLGFSYKKEVLID
ncbi:hypothetical protein [Bacillus sp. CGMCC 1.16541]|uniref:hypothetical protein n=1 Tax=Bacillus sp. CGMCC 1.16541 TaxID=2185143 RepID=UPI000D730661|nr:hypothetical protein [Bacillus sp. CGMCC 1.16541]